MRCRPFVVLVLAAPAVSMATEQMRGDAGAAIETMVVRAPQPSESNDDAESARAQSLQLREAAILPSTIVDLLTRLPGVAETGQGGWLQMYSLRGSSRQRVITFFDEIPIITDRRAGTAAHFIDPVLLTGATVIAAPASGTFSTGALGGIVRLMPRALDGIVTGLQLDDNGRGRGTHAGWGDAHTTVMLAALKRDDSKAGDGTVINDHGQRWSALASHQWSVNGGEMHVLAAPALLNNVGRANANFYRNRITDTPDETHLPLGLSYRSQQGWEASWFVHDHFISNETRRVGIDLTTVDNEATDTGVAVQMPWHGDVFHGRLGVDWLGRLSVQAKEMAYSIQSDSTVVRRALDEGEEHQLALFGELETDLLGGEVHLGARWIAHQQSVRGEPHRDDTGYATHITWQRHFGDRARLLTSLGCSLRFPSLSERFYRGTTGRGTLIGNADLRAESALSFDAGLETRVADAVVTAKYFRQRVDDYIEEVIIQPDPQINSFVNLDEGSIDGVELDARWRATGSLTLVASAHRMRGNSDDGQPLADMAADRVRVGAEKRISDCTLELSWAWRSDKGEIGPDEVDLDSADYGEAALACHFGEQWNAAVALANAGDELYYANADSQATLMPGRRFSLRLSWSR